MKVGLVAGEASGDLLGAGLIRAIRARIPDASFEGVAGPEMVAAGCERWEDAERLAVFGLIEPLKHIPELLRLRRTLVERWTASPPDVFVGIDAPDFNLGLEQRLKAVGIPTVHYVCPSVWAWRQGRIKTIARSVDRVLCILPFERDFCLEHGVDAVFVGHPKADSLPEQVDVAGARAQLGIDADARVVALLPGSRATEVTRLGPLFAEAAKQLADERADLVFVVPVATPKLRTLIETQVRDAGLHDRAVLTDGDSLTVMSAADVVLLASGTAALESALLCKPTVAAYKVAAVTSAIVRAFGLIKVDRFTIPNLLTDTPRIPEFIQGDAKPAALADAVGHFLDDGDAAAAVSARFAKLRSELALDSDQRAAEAVISVSKHAAS